MLFRKFKILRLIKNFYIVSLLFLVVYLAKAQDETAIDMVVESITEDDLKNHLAIIAHDSLEGRETGQEGLRKAAQYLRSQFERIGLDPVNIRGKDTYYQSFPLYHKKCGDVLISVDENAYKNMEDMLYVNNAPQTSDENIDVVFVGHSNTEDYKKLNCKNRGVAMLNSEDGWRNKVKIAREAGVKDIFIIYGDTEEDIDILISQYRDFYQSSSLKLDRTMTNNEGNLFIITPDLAEKIFNRPIQMLKSAADKSLKNKYRSLKKIPVGNLSYSIECMEDEIYTENILGFIRGIEKPEEVVVISAHYDHIGRRGDEIYNGADDNGSGTVAVLELAEAYTIAKKMGIDTTLVDAKNRR